MKTGHSRSKASFNSLKLIKEREEKGCIWEAHKGFETKTKLQMKMLGQADS